MPDEILVPAKGLLFDMDGVLISSIGSVRPGGGGGGRGWQACVGSGGPW